MNPLSSLGSNMDDFFYGPALKIDRADEHISVLEGVVAAFVKDTRDSLFGKPNIHSGYSGWSFGGDLPKHFPSILGDAVHNLRAALDHWFALLVVANGSTTDRHTAFPFRNTRADLVGALKGLKQAGKAPADIVNDFIIDEIQPYKGGQGHSFYVLHELDIADKHRGLLDIVQKIHFINAHFQDGGHWSNVSMETNGKHPATPVLKAPAPVKEHPENKIAIQILFGESTPFKGQGIIPVMKSLSNNVSIVVGHFNTKAVS